MLHRYLPRFSSRPAPQSLSLPALRAVLAGHGFVPAGRTKADILAEVSAELCGDAAHEAERANAGGKAGKRGATLLLEATGAGGGGAKAGKAGKRARREVVYAEDSEEDGSEFDPSDSE